VSIAPGDDTAKQLQHLLSAYDSIKSSISAGADYLNMQEIQELLSSTEKAIRKIAEQYPIIRDFLSLEGIDFEPAIRLILLLKIEKASSVSGIWQYCGYGIRPGTFNTEARELCILLTTQLTEPNAAYASAYEEALKLSDNVSQKARALITRTILAHLYEHWRQYLGRLKKRDLPNDRPFADRHKYGWPQIAKE
jgi:hypothetical protein